MTTIVYTLSEEVMTSKLPNSAPRNVQKFTVKVMGDTTPTGGRSSGSQRQGSPKPQKRFSVRYGGKGHKSKPQVEVQSSFPMEYNPHMFTITAYLPYDGGKRLKLQCCPGMTVQQVIETEIPDISRTGYQVYQFPSRALLNPEKDASVLQDQEISIEPMRFRSPDNAGDERLAIVRELLRTEDAYLENLRNIFDIYMEPLRKWGLAQNDMNTLFRSLSRLCDLLMNFFSELELTVQYWNTRSTQIGGLFKQYPSFWDMYEEYSYSYARACKLLKDKRVTDESFSRFLELKRGAARHTLESLMLLPVQRIYDYHRLLVQLYTITPKDHLDYHDLRYTVACVSTMVQAREQQLNESQNETKLEQVQLRFPSDNLFLSQSLNVMESAIKRTRSMSTPGSQRSLRHSKQRSFDMDQPDLGEFARREVRLYLQEGPVKIITGLQSHERYFFLFDDTLIIGKPTGRQRSQQRLYKRKEQLRLSEMWVTDCMGEVMEATLPPNTAFVLGWPITNCVAAFSSPEEKSLWYTLLSKNIALQRKGLQPDLVSIQIVNLTKSSNNIPTMMQVHCIEQTKDVLLRALDMLAIAVAETNCQMWVKITGYKGEAAYPLIGHECPFAIQVSHNRYQMDLSVDSRPTQIQFVIKRRSPIPSDSQMQNRTRKTFQFPWAKGKWGRGGVSSKRKKFRMFGAPLAAIVINNQLPEILQEMLIRLYTEGPTTLGIFRQSANHRKVKELKEAIDNREQVDLSEVSIHVVGALLKELLRSVPGCILVSSRYTELVATNDIKDMPTRVLHLQKVLAKLPEENQLFLQYLMPLLHYIACNEEINCMNSVNLAICFAPSLLWPDLGLDVIKNEVPYLVKFMIELSPEIFGQQLPELYQQANLPSSPGVEKVEFMLEQDVQYVPTKVEDGAQFHHKRTNSLETSTSEESGEDEPHSNLRKAQNSGLTVSDSQLSQISQQREQYTGSRVTEVSGRRRTGAGMYEDRPSSKRPRKTRRRPERSNSYRGPNERPPYSRMYQRPAADPNRRKSIATQTTLPRHLPDYSPQLMAIPSSPSSSFSSSSQSFSPQINPRRPVPIDESSGLYMYLPPQTPPKMKKRNFPQYSQSFSQPFSRESVHKPQKPIPTSTSTSFYDKLLPLDPDVKVKSQAIGDTDSPSHTQKTTQEEEFPIPVVTWPDASLDMKGKVLGEDGGSTPVGDPGPQVGRPLQSQPALSYQSVTSSHSASSSSSQHLPPMPMSIHHPPTYPAQTRPNNISRASSHSGGSGGSMNRGSPDMLMQLEQTPLSKLNKEFIKVAISKRFDLSSTDSSQIPPREAPNPSPYGHLSSNSYVHESKHMGVKPTKVSDLDKEQPHVKNIQKLQERRVGSSTSATTDSSFTKSQSYHSFLSAHRTKDLNFDVVNVDDLPESEQHLNSLPRPSTAESMRPHKGMMHYPYIPEVVQVAGLVHVESEQDHNKLYPGSGYNSDTESSPSRTLSRPGKLNEVASPTKTTIPHRYKSPMFYPTTETRIQPRYYASRDPTQIKDQGKQMHHQYVAAVPDMTTLEPHYNSPAHSEPSQLEQEGASASLLRQNSVSKVIRVGHKLDGRNIRKELEKQENTTPVRRPKSGDPSKAHSSREKASDIESAKVKLGLIPRQRSKSTSESEAMRIIHKVLEEDELAMQQHQSSRPTAEEERAEKHKGWLLSAPTSAERKKAWEQHSRNAPHFQRTDIHSRSLREEGRPNIPIKETLRTSLTPDVRRKSSTMPEYFSAVTRTGNRRQLGKGLVRTVKVTSSEVPQPRTIRRINTRTYC